jgi:hypothetical protein
MCNEYNPSCAASTTVTPFTRSPLAVTRPWTRQVTVTVLIQRSESHCLFQRPGAQAQATFISSKRAQEPGPEHGGCPHSPCPVQPGARSGRTECQGLPPGPS